MLLFVVGYGVFMALVANASTLRQNCARACDAGALSALFVVV